MNKNNRFNRFGLICGAAFTLTLGLATTPQAQAGGVDDQGYQSNEKNGIYKDAPAGLDPLEIMHRAQQSNGRSAEEFNQDSQLQIDSSVLDFKRLQQQRIMQQQSGNNLGVEAVEAVENTEIE